VLACHLATLAPVLILAAALETTRIPRVASLTGGCTAVVTTRPFGAPHHTIAHVGLIGGGQVLMSGERSLAHHGVLFPDELPEFRRHVLEVLRQPLEDGILYIQLHGRPRSGCFCGFSRTRGPQGARADHSSRASPPLRSRRLRCPTSLFRCSVCGHLVLFA